MIKELTHFLKTKGFTPSLVERELQRGDLLQAASYGFDKLTKHQIAEFVRNSCRVGIAKPQEIHRRIINLGPKCYVTTNYDKLLELSFQKWHTDTYYRTVINRQLTETAEIIGARSTNFLFKLHGDVEDAESIILTREHYRTLNPGGELHHALEAVKTLMVSRPFVYIGFGLKDPDFIYLKDLLFNTFKGGTRDHYAIMADINEQEKDYWRRNFGIHLISYETTINDNSEKNHTPLLNLLDELCYQPRVDIKTDLTISPEFILSLARHASKYSRVEKSLTHIPLITHHLDKRESKIKISLSRFSRGSIENLLDKGPEKIILIGLPGSGKSYSLKHSASRIADELCKACIEDSFQPESILIPIFGDLKLYNGSIDALLENTLPPGMSLDLLLSKFKVKIYLDAFNEIPCEYIESNVWENDFSNFIKKASKNSIIIASRTSDGLKKLEIPIFSIDSIKKEFIESYLNKIGIELKGRFKKDIFSILQRPFFYKLLSTSYFKISSETSPRKIYEDLLLLTNSSFQKRFQIEFDLLPILSIVAIEAIDNGVESFKIRRLKECLDSELIKYNSGNLPSEDIVNWLVSQEFLIPLFNERICFFHQSITEFLAAKRLAQMFKSNPEILKEKLTYRRWDQALFLTLSLLNQKKSKKFLENVINIDFELALSAVRFMESDNAEVIERLLFEISQRASSDNELMFSIAHILEDKLPISSCHIQTIKKLINYGNALGGSAVSLILKTIGEEFKDDALELLVKYCDDYNFCSIVGRELQNFITKSDLPKLLEITDQVQERLNAKEIKRYEGFDSALGNIISEFDPEIVYNTFFNSKKAIKEQSVRLAVICDFLQDTKSSVGFKIAFNLLDFGVYEAIFTIHMISSFSKEKESLDWTIVKDTHVLSLLKLVKKRNKEDSFWALDTIKNICTNRKELIHNVVQESKKNNGVLKAALLYCVIENDKSQVFEALTDLCKLSSEQLTKEKYSLLQHMDLNWKEHESLLVDLLKLRNIHLAIGLCDPIVLDYGDNQDLILNIGPINWWLNWFLDFQNTGSKEWMFEDRVSSVISKCISRETRNKFIEEFNNPKTPYRKILSKTILRNIDDLSIDEITENAIAYLIDELKKSTIDPWTGNLLVNISTESFVADRLLPLLNDAKGKFYNNLIKLLEWIGKRHGRRYMIN
jgi:hypothetical protein